MEKLTVEDLDNAQSLLDSKGPGAMYDFLSARYNEKLDMFVVQRVDRDDPVTARVYYWRERQGEITAMFECLWSIRLEEFYLCRGNFAFVETELSVDLLFSEEKLWEWQKITGAIKETVLSKVK